MIQSTPLNKLMPSPRNVRRSSDEQADRQLKADIAARGLLQNLVVAPAKPRGSFTVAAGGRRLRALKALADEAKQRALAWVPDPMRFAPALEFIAGAQSDELPSWDEEPASSSEHASDEEPESGGDDAGSDGCEPSRVEEAA